MKINEFYKLLVIISTSVAGILVSTSEVLALTFKFNNVTFNDGGVLVGSFDYDSETEEVSQVNIFSQGGDTSLFGNSNQYTSLSTGDFESQTFLSAFTVSEYGSTIGFGITLEGSINTATEGQVIPIRIDPGVSLEIVDFPNYGLRYVTGGSLVAVPEPITLLGAGTALAFGAYFKRKVVKK